MKGRRGLVAGDLGPGSEVKEVVFFIAQRRPEWAC